ncbi:MAG: IclR family transcriptional regulator [Candidimonas sp.]
MAVSSKNNRPATPPSPPDNAPSTTMAPLRAMSVLGILAKHQEGLSLTQMSDALGMPKTSLFSLLKSLNQGGYVSATNGLYNLGAETHHLATIISKRSPFPDCLRPELIKLHQACGETVSIGIPSESWKEFIYLDVIEANSSLRFRANVGARRPLYCTSPGLALLAFAPRQIQEKYIQSIDLEPITPTTITSKRKLAAALKHIADHCIAVSDGSVEGATGMSAPIFDAHRNLRGAVGLAGVSTKIRRNEARYTELLLETAARMSSILGFDKDYPPTLGELTADEPS